MLSSRRRALRPTTQVPGQEDLHPAVEVKAVLLVVKPVSLIVLHEVLDIDAPLPKRLHDLVRPPRRPCRSRWSRGS